MTATNGVAMGLDTSETGKTAMKLPLLRRETSVRVTLYSKSDCSLCMEAERVVKRVYGSRQVDVVDIIGDRKLEDEFIFRIPVLVVGGRVLAEGQITMADARMARQAAHADHRSSERT